MECFWRKAFIFWARSRNTKNITNWDLKVSEKRIKKAKNLARSVQGEKENLHVKMSKYNIDLLFIEYIFLCNTIVSQASIL